MPLRRHDYYLDLTRLWKSSNGRDAIDIELRPVTASDIDELARLMLDAYRGTIDYQDEDIDDAREEVRSYFRMASDGEPVTAQSRLAFRDGRLISACLCTRFTGEPHPLIAYVMTSPAEKGRGIARYLLMHVLEQLSAAGHKGVSAVITEGNTPSERLFRNAGFTVRDPRAR